MADDPRGWPDASKPGYPESPERDRWHWMQDANGNLWCWRWYPRPQWFWTGNRTVRPREATTEYRYLGPCLTPAEITAREAAAYSRGFNDGQAGLDAAVSVAEAASAEALKRLAVLAARQVPIPEDCGFKEAHGRLAGSLDAAFAIDAIPHASALTRALAAAEKRGVEKAAKWHDDCAAMCRRLADQGIRAEANRREATEHDLYAEHIRSLGNAAAQESEG